MRKLILALLLMGVWNQTSYSQVTTLSVVAANNITGPSQILDNRSRASTYHGFAVTGTGTWSVTIQYSANKSSWTSFSDSTATVTNSSATGIGAGIGYHAYIRFTVTGTAIINYTGQRGLNIPLAPATGSCATCVTSGSALTSGQLIFGAGSLTVAPGDLSGDVATSGSGATVIQPNAVTNAKILNATIAEAKFNFTDVTTANATSSKHGLLPKLSGSSADCFVGDGTYITCPGGSGASTTLNNLGTTNINASLLFQTTLDIGSTVKPPRHVYFYADGIWGTNYFKLTGTPTGARIISFPDATDTLVGKATTDTLTNKTLTVPVIASFINATHNHQSAAGGGTLSEAALVLTDNTTNNTSTSNHGFAPKLSGSSADCFVGDGTFITCPGGGSNLPSLYTATASKTVGNTVTETSLIGTGSGSVTTAANFFSAGTNLAVELTGYFSSVSADTLNVKMKAGSTVVGSTGAVAQATLTNQAFRLYALVTCRTTGSSGTFIVNTILEEANGTNAKIVNTSVVNLDTTGTLAWDITATWGTAAAGDTITATNFTMFTPGGSAAAPVTLTTVTYSATPVFTRTTQIQEWAITLTGNVTSSTTSGVLSADILVFNITQDGTGSRTFVWPTGFSEACTISGTASITTKQTFYWDGSAAHAITPCVTTSTGLILTGATSAAPATPASGSATVYVDATQKVLSDKNDAGTVHHTVATTDCTSTVSQVVTKIGADGSVTCGYPGLVLLEQYTASSSASLAFTTCLSSAFDEYEIDLVNVIPATNSVSLLLTVSTDGGSTYASTNYGYGVWIHGGTNSADTSNQGSTSASSIFITSNDGSINNAVTGGVSSLIRLYSPSSTAVYKQFKSQSEWYHTNATYYGTEGMGVWKGTTAINAFKFAFSSGNIASGIIRCYGVAK